MKSAYEKAMEKIAGLEKASPEELRRMECVPKGNALGAKYISGEVSDLKSELENYDSDSVGYLREGIEKTLLRNISLPQNDHARQVNSTAMQGLLVLKKDKARAKGVFGKIEQLCQYYEQARQHTFVELRKSFQSRLDQTRTTLAQQAGAMGDMDAESHPQFLEEWRMASAELNFKYEEVLAEHKKEILAIK